MADAKISYGYIFLMLMLYQACCEYSVAPLSGITKSHWCRATPTYIGLYALSLVTFIALFTMVTKVCSDLYIQDLLKVRYARYAYGKHLAHLIAVPLESLAAVVKTVSDSIDQQSGAQSRLNSASLNAVRVDNFLKVEDPIPPPAGMVGRSDSGLRDPSMRPMLPVVLTKALGLISRLLRIIQYSSGSTIDINGPVEVVPFLESIYVEYIDSCEEARVELMVPSDESVVALAGKCIAVDLEKMKLALTDILDNSLAFAKSGGIIALAAEVVSSDDIPRVRSTAGTVPTLTDYRHEYVEIRIQDSSLGLSEEELEDVFSREIGPLSYLGMVKSLVELHEGAVFLQSPGEDKGIEINLYLPIISLNVHRRKPLPDLVAQQAGSFHAITSKIIPADISVTGASIADTLMSTAKSARNLLGADANQEEDGDDMATKQVFKYIPNLAKVTSPRSKQSSYGNASCGSASYGSSNDDEASEERFDAHRYSVMKMGTDGHGGNAFKPSPVLAFDIDADYGFDVSNLAPPSGSHSAQELSYQRETSTSIYRGAPAGSGRYGAGSARYGGIDPMGLMASLAMAAGGSLRQSVASTPRQGREPSAREIHNSLRAIADANNGPSRRTSGIISGAAGANSRRTSGTFGASGYGGVDPLGLIASLNKLAQPANNRSSRQSSGHFNIEHEDGGSIFRQNSRTGVAAHRAVRRESFDQGDNDGPSFSFAGSNILRQSSRTGYASYRAVSRQNSNDIHGGRSEMGQNDFEITPAGTSNAAAGIMRQSSGGIQGHSYNSNQPSIQRNLSGETNASGRYVLGSRASSGGFGDPAFYVADDSPVLTGSAMPGEMRRNSRTGQIDISPGGTGKSSSGSMRRGAEAEHSGMEMRRNSRTGQIEISPGGTGRSITGSMRRGAGGVAYSNQHSFGGSEMSYASHLTGLTTNSIPHGEVANIDSLRDNGNPTSGFSTGRSIGVGAGPVTTPMHPWSQTPANHSRVSSAQSQRPDIGMNTPNSFSPYGTYQGGAGMMRAT
jgi:signal transduction histidine kinase